MHTYAHARTHTHTQIQAHVTHVDMYIANKSVLLFAMYMSTSVT